MEEMSGKQFEAQIVDLSRLYKASGQAHITRCGVQAVRLKEEWKVIPSLPDFEGVVPGGRQFLFDCKVCSQASFDLSKYRADTKGARSRQLKHMLERAQFDVVAFFLIHWNPRSGKTFSHPAVTTLIPVHPNDALWQEFERGEIRSIARSDAEKWGYVVNWVKIGSGVKLRPDLVTSVLGLM